MTTFSTQIFACPHCNNRMYRYELNSYHVYDSVTYSDGYIDYDPPIPFNSRFIICSGCQKASWTDDIKFEESYNDENLPKSLDAYELLRGSMDNIDYGIANYYLDLIGNGFADTTEREILLRMEIWHLLNNQLRYGSISILKQLFLGKFRFVSTLIKRRSADNRHIRQTKKLLRENLTKLITIYIPEGDEDWLMLAEMHREIRNFKRAKKAILYIEKLTHTSAYKQIKIRITTRRSKVFKLN